MKFCIRKQHYYLVPLVFVLTAISFYFAFTSNTYAATCGLNDGSITFYDDVGGGQCIGVITSGTTFTTPSDWTSTNKIEVIGAGGNGGDGTGGGASGKGGSGGGAGAYGVVNNTSSLSTSQTYDINIGAAHSGTALSTAQGTWLCTTNGAGGCTTVSDTNVLVGAQSGAKGANGGASGGAGGNSGTNKTNNGGAGASASGGTSSPGAGGGGAAGASGAGNAGSGQTGGAGDNGSGGAAQTTAGAAGNAGSEWTVNGTTYGSGGAGAGQNAGGGAGGTGGLYGAGGGGAGGNGNIGGAGRQGIIVITYTPAPQVLTLSGTLYEDEGSTNTTGQYTINMAAGTSTPGVYSTTTNPSTGAWSIVLPEGHGIGAGTPLVFWVDGVATATAALVTKSNSSPLTISGLDLYLHRVIVRHEATTGTSTTIADMAIYDSSDDPSIPYTATTTGTDSLIVAAGNELHVWTEDVFAPGGTIQINAHNSASSTDGTLHLAASSTLTQSGSITIGGSFRASSSATFNASTTTGIIFIATTTGKTITGDFTGSNTLGSTTFNGSGGGWTFTDANASTTNLTITNGTVVAPTVGLTISGDYTNNGTFTHNTGTVFLANATSTFSGTMTGTSAFNNLTLKEGVIPTTEGTYITDWDTAADGNTNLWDVTTDGTNIWTVDDTGDQVYKWDMNGNYVSDWDTAADGNTSLVAITTDGTNIWTTDNVGDQIYKWDMDGNYVSDWDTAADGNSDLWGIATDGTNIWTTDGPTTQVYKWDMNGTYVTDWDTAADGNTSLFAIATDGTNIWTVQGAGAQIHKWDMTGTHVSDWDTAADGNTVVRGVTTDGTNIWTIDATASQVYKWEMDGAGGTPASLTFSNNASTTDFTIGTSSSVTAPSGSLTIAGDYMNNGTFYSNGGKIFFAPQGAKTASGNLTGTSTLNDVQVTGTPTTTPTVEGTYLSDWDTNADGNSVVKSVTTNSTNIWTTDSSGDQVYKWDMDGNYVSDWDTAADGNIDLFAITTDGTNIWTTDSVQNQVYKWDMDGNYVSDWDTAADGNTGLFGITTDGTNIWTTDDSASQVYKWTMDGTYVTDWDTAADGNSFPFDIATDGTNMWTTDINDLQVYKWDMSGNYVSDWDTAADGNGSLYGIGTDSTYIWTVDGSADQVYKWDSGAGLYEVGSLTFANNASTTDLILTNASSTVVAPTLLSIGGDYTNNGNFTAGNGTTTFDGSTAQTLSGTMTGTSTFQNIEFSGSGAKSFGSSPASTTNFFINSGSGSVTLPSTNLTITGNLTNNGTIDSNSGAITFDPNGEQTVSGTLTGTSALNDVRVAGSGDSLIAEGTYITDWDTNAAGNDLLYGITTDGTNIWTGDGASQVYKWTMDGTYVTDWDTAADGNTDTYGVATDGINIWTTDNTGAQVYKWTMDGTYVSDWDTAADGNTDLWNITTDGTNIWTQDNIQSKVYKWDMNGNYVSDWDTSAAGNTDMYGIGTDGNYIWTADSAGDRIYKWTMDGTYVSDWDTAADGNTVLSGVTTDGVNIWTADEFAGQVYKREMQSGSLSTITFTSNASTSDLTIVTASSTMVAPTLLSISGDYTNNGTFTAGNGTTTFDGSTAQTLSGTMTGSSSFNHLEFTNTGAKSFGSSPASSTNFFVNSGSGSVTLPSTNLTVAGNFTNNGTIDNNSGRIIFKPNGPQSLSGSLTGINALNNVTVTGVSTGGSMTTEGTYVTDWDTGADGNTEPYGITTDGTNIWTADYTGAQVYKWDMDGNYVSDWDTNADGNSSPVGITTDGTNIWTADYTGAQVYKWDMDGNYVSDWDTNADGNTEPIGIATDGINIWTADTGGDQVYKWSMTGTYVSDWDTAADGNTSLFGITTDGTNIWTSDLANTQVFKWDMSGTYDSDWDTNADGNTQPYGITTDNTNIWTTENNNTQVYKWERDGTAGSSDITFSNNASTSDFVISTSTTTLVAPTYLSIAGDYTNNGTFDSNSGTVYLDGTSLQTATGTMTGSSSFANLTISNTSGTDAQSDPSVIFGASASTSGNLVATTPGTKLQFAGGATSTFQTITLAGDSGSYVSLRSTIDGTQWGLVVPGTRSVDYVDVEDSAACTQYSNISTTNSINSDGNNICWDNLSTPGGGAEATISSAANQVFEINQATTSISTITITDNATPVITSTNDIRIAIATSSVDMRWNTYDTTAVLGGTGAASTSATVSYGGDGSVLILDVTSNFKTSGTLTISGLSFSQFNATNSAVVALQLRTDGAGDTSANDSDDKTVTITGSLTLANHDAGQTADSFTFNNQTETELFAFKLTPTAEEVDISSLAISLIGVKKLNSNNLQNLKLYRDWDADGVYDSGSDTQIGGSGAYNIDGETGSITFSTSFTATTTQNYLVIGDTNAIKANSYVTFDLLPADITAVGGLTSGSITPTGNVTDVQHIRAPGGGAAGGQYGGAPPASDGDVGGGSDDGGEEIGSTPGFEDPGASGTPDNEWTNGSNALSSDGSYATAASTLNQSYRTFGFNIPGSNTIDGVEVKLEASASTNNGTIDVTLSWDNGSSNTSVKSTITLSTTDTVYLLGSPSDKWGRTWSPSDFSDANFVVRVTSQPNSNTVQLDAIQVKPYHKAGGGGGGGGGEIEF